MQEEFEKKVQNRMQTFGMQPSPQVWDDIDAALGKRKHRRIFIGWWILLGLVIAGGGLLFYQKDNILHNELNQQPVPVVDSTPHNNLAQTPAAATPAQKPAEETEPVTLIKPSAPNGGGAKNNNTTQTNSQHYTPSSNTATIPLSTTAIKSPATGSNLTAANAPIHNGIANTNTPVNNGNNQPLANNNTPNSSTAEQGNTPNAGSIAELPPPAPQATSQDSTVIQQPAKLPQAPVNAVTNQPPAPGKTPVAITPKTIASSRHQWFFTFGGGTTQTTSFGSFNNTGQAGMSAPVTGGNYDVVPGFTAFAAQSYDISKPKEGFHLFAGLTHQYKLAKQWRLTGGLQVAYLTNRQQTGTYVKSNPIYLNANYLSQYAAGTDKIYQEDYYQAGAPGSQYTVVNKAWQLQVPVNVSYVVNPRAKTKVLVNAGLTAAWTVNSRWIIPDTRFNKLYYNKAILNGAAVSWQAGPAVELKNQWRFGLQYQQSFTTLAKTYVTPKLYWQNVSLYAGIPLNITLKKHKK